MSVEAVWAIIVALGVGAEIYILFFWVPPEYGQKSNKRKDDEE